MAGVVAGAVVAILAPVAVGPGVREQAIEGRALRQRLGLGVAAVDALADLLGRQHARAGERAEGQPERLLGRHAARVELAPARERGAFRGCGGQAQQPLERQRRCALRPWHEASSSSARAGLGSGSEAARRSASSPSSRAYAAASSSRRDEGRLGLGMKTRSAALAGGLQLDAGAQHGGREAKPLGLVGLDGAAGGEQLPGELARAS